MEKLTKDFMYQRIQDVLTKDKEYMNLEKTEKDSCIVQAKAEEICYISGFNDALDLILRGI